MSSNAPPPPQPGGTQPQASPLQQAFGINADGTVRQAPGSAGAKKSPPPPPDYTGAAEKQLANNRPNQTTDFGSTTWTKDANGNWTQNTSLAPGMEGLKDNFTQQLSGASGQDAWKRAFDAAYGQETSRLNPMWDQRESALQQQLANQGLDMNSQAASGAYGNFNRGRNDAYASAFNNAFGLGQQAQAQNFTEGMAGLGGLHGLEAAPSFATDGGTLPATIAKGNADMQAWQTQMQQWADILRGGVEAAKAGAGVPRAPGT